jgi:ubiquitin-protein ligase
MPSDLLSTNCVCFALHADHSLQPEIAKQYDTDREAFNQAAREHTKQHAM